MAIEISEDKLVMEEGTAVEEKELSPVVEADYIAPPMATAHTLAPIARPPVPITNPPPPS